MIEQSCAEAQTEFGMDHYEVRKHPGWHQQYADLSARAFLPLACENPFGEKTPALTLSQMRTLYDC